MVWASNTTATFNNNIYVQCETHACTTFPEFAGIINADDDCMTINAADNTKVDIKAGCAQIVTKHPTTGVYERTFFRWPAMTITPTLTSTYATSWISMQSDATVTEQVDYPCVSEMNAAVPIGQLAHFAAAGTIDYVYNFPKSAYSPTSHASELNRQSAAHLTGLTITPNGANMHINIGEGYSARMGGGSLAGDVDIHHDPGEDAVSFAPIIDQPSGLTIGTFGQDLDVTHYYDATTGAFTVASTNKYTKNWLYYLPVKPGVRLLGQVFGTGQFNTITAAKAAAEVPAPPLGIGVAIKLALIIAKESVVDLEAGIAAGTVDFQTIH